MSHPNLDAHYGPASSMRSIRWWIETSPFWAVHLACLGAIWTGVSWWSIGLCFGLYYLRMFGVTGGYHRYFSHRTFKCNRFVQFLFALLAQSSGQKGALWWAANHRHHHRHSDEDTDHHSPKHGFWHAHVGWILDHRFFETNYSLIPDFAKYPELRFLNKYPHLPAIGLAIVCYLLGSWEAVFVGFFWSTVLCWHGTFCINSLTHIFGKRVYPTSDDSKNSFILALVTMGEGWHNNHHYYQSCTRQGFRWYEVDPTWYILLAMEKLRIIHDCKRPPARVLQRPSLAERQPDLEDKVVEPAERRLTA